MKALLKCLFDKIDKNYKITAFILLMKGLECIVDLSRSSIPSDHSYRICTNINWPLFKKNYWLKNNMQFSYQSDLYD